ncbi:hypothetical protein BH11ACT4_BH11ACT4_16090 [soil metagenome]
MASDFDPRFDPAYQRGYVAGFDGEAGAAVTPAESSAPQAANDAKAQRNPWLVVLWVLGAVLLGGGVAGYVWAASQANPDYEVTGVVYPAVVRALAPWVTVVGLGAVVLAVYVQAVQWRRP